MQNSSRQGHVHEHIYALVGHQIGNIKTWKPQHDAVKDKGVKVADRHHVRLPLGCMDGRTWYQLATLLSRSYCMVSSNVLRMKNVKGDGMWYT